MEINNILETLYKRKETHNMGYLFFGVLIALIYFNASENNG